MKLWLSALFIGIVVYYSYQLIRVLFKMKQSIVFPATEREWKSVRKFPLQAVYSPEFSKQKSGILLYSFILLSVLAMLLLGVYIEGFDWTFILPVFLPIAYSNSLLNLFAVVKGGILSGNRFIPWHKIKSFQFIPITMNHRFYGFGKEVNDGWELEMKTKFFSASCIITSRETKEKLAAILREQAVIELEEESPEDGVNS
ncbi:hypothetical protein [Bacillus xiapuensis]|uniref:hypothetical protein n=1 Tax=Bacillus xiapuensis TaxID=2014075 RepID=UPI000C2455C2|nr:hypothetical protein [Bacillus xiapuensis]